MSQIEESIGVDAPLGVVYDLWTRFTEFPRFMGGVERIDRIGYDLTHWVTNVDGVHREFDARITEHIPEERIAWESVGGTRQAGVVTFHRVTDQHAKVMLQLDLDPHGLLDILGDRLGFVSHRVQLDLREFKRFAEDHYQQQRPDRDPATRRA
ncbi:SRPBCC family protein [Streptacidiphilus sp. P02-A3a]|uniref:SRPBCC family protein n=1 Tax=Streptacidiphilus sp. P02-A3a TaxID=2704468 RepID=UPI0015FAD48E|nr:SRPBCC family protein [Streptacidiphilus sp. P02-A3a]QMU70529.1 SRPBCC family protein [Streptacidiphilus sp. P02-A3a]